MAVHPLSESSNSKYNDFDTVDTLLQEIGLEKGWSTEDINGDIKVLCQNRISYVSDLRILSPESWTQIQLLPLVKDLLRLAIASNDDETQNKNKPTSGKDQKEKNKKKGNNKKDKNQEKKKKEKKETKKENGFVSPSPLGTPVVPIVLRPPPAVNGYNSTDDDEYSQNGISQDHLTMHNTILNGNTSCGSSAEDDDEEEEIMSPSGTVRRKSVSFSNETSIIVDKKKDKDDNQKKKKKDKKNKIKSENGKY